MATSPDPKRRDDRLTASTDRPRHPAPLGATQEPLAAKDRLDSDSPGRTSPGAMQPREQGRGLTATFAVLAAVLLVVFLVALYMGAEGTNQATAPSGTQAPVADPAPGTPDDATGSTIPVEPQDTAPANP